MPNFESVQSSNGPMTYMSVDMKIYYELDSDRVFDRSAKIAICNLNLDFVLMQSRLSLENFLDLT